jgi:hypothetical protein
MANTYSTQDLVKRTLQYAGEVTDGSSQYHSLALVYLNKVYDGIIAGESEFAPDIGEPWVWARAQLPINITLQPIYTQGTVSLVTGSTQGTFGSTGAPTISYQNGYLKPVNGASYYLITQHTAGTSAFTIDTPFLEISTSASGFYLYPLIYELSSSGLPSPIQRLAEPFRVYDTSNPMPFVDQEQTGKIFGIDINQFQRIYPLALLETGGVPERFAVYRRTDTSYQVIFNNAPAPSCNPMKVDLDYIPLQDSLTDSNTSVPLLPRNSRPLLADGAAFYLLTDKEDEKAQIFFQRCAEGIKTMWRAQNRQIWRTSKDRGRLNARQDLQKRKFNFYW